VPLADPAARMRILMALEPQRMIDHPLSSRSVTMVPDDAPIHTGAKSKPRQRGD